jgi:hypothetical protein
MANTPSKTWKKVLLSFSETSVSYIVATIGLIRFLTPNLGRYLLTLNRPYSTKMTILNGVAQLAPEKLEPVTSKKLHGRAFYESIGSPKYIVAPMVDRSEFVGVAHLDPCALKSN